MKRFMPVVDRNSKPLKDLVQEPNEKGTTWLCYVYLTGCALQLKG